MIYNQNDNQWIRSMFISSYKFYVYPRYKIMT
jgi:hypothetical protein